MKIFTITVALFLLGSHAIYKSPVQDTMPGGFEKFDMDDFTRKSRASTPGKVNLNDFKTGNGIRIVRKATADGYSEEQIQALPFFYKTSKKFYASGFIKEKGQEFGDLTIDGKGIKIGKWYYFNESGKLEKEIDEDKKFGKFGYLQLLEFLDLEGVINIRNGQNRDHLFAGFESGTSGNKVWNVKVIKASVPAIQGWVYKIDGDTGKVLESKALSAD
ncbi:hypothetical protein [Pedobacter metabolipauper]|uniref:Uncharacterized protein n=1 Tax=Pedobacter metabolipauper TaxID=425513 RepID=A0A4R6SRN8_9SPHI|nr:hypothetical protein [Pedobacter metabolipauper]TDQ07112.1 hypothetical protein ATK78_4128 [Pedobacter metabolipauper]